MYTTCLFCNKPLGRNEIIEHFPIGRRLAYDAAKGRLWVVCRACERWNLTPLDERWEAIDECERQFEGTRVRAATENIGLAKLREGLELVRIGVPLRPEFAAWRYGDQFGRRRRRHLIVAGGVVAAGATLLTGMVAAGVGVFLAGNLGHSLLRLATHGRPLAEVARVLDGDGRMLRVQRIHLRSSIFTNGESAGPSILLTHVGGATILAGATARRALGPLLRAANVTGGTRDEVAQAIGRIERAGGAEQFLTTAGRHASKLAHVVSREEARSFAESSDVYASGLMALPTTLRLAMEMALHEESERRAMEGELAELEAAWRRAEEIASIADGLLLPSAIDESVAAARRAGNDRSA